MYDGSNFLLDRLPADLLRLDGGCRYPANPKKTNDVCQDLVHLREFSNRAWYRRMWVVQEALLWSDLEFLVFCDPIELFESCTTRLPLVDLLTNLEGEKDRAGILMGLRSYRP